MAKANTQNKTQTQNEERHNKRGELLFTTLTPDNNFYKENPNLLQLAQYLTTTGKNSFKMKSETDSIFSFTDYSIYNMDIINGDGELIEQTLFVIAYDHTSNTCYYSMSKGLTAEFEKLAQNKIIPSNGYCKWTARVIEKTFKTDTGAEKRTFNLEILGIENFNSDVVCEKRALIESAPESEEQNSND